MSNVIIGEKVKVERMNLMINNKLHSAFFPRIEVNGELCLIKDQNSPSGYVEGDTRSDAKKKGEKELQKIRMKRSTDAI
ncbi:hypothetical protein [Sutcliffiella cohnii]|uniref:hypothetical protein n=1 Tax=Sutcliffiella cohnii TaxID=33932 RepID=UPI000833E1B3|nr:hypothetical protein [Sutcliffiella cohnii]